MSHHYRDRLARIPPPPPPLPPPPPIEDEPLLLKMRAPSPSSDVYEVGHPDFHSDVMYMGDEGGRDFDDVAPSGRRKGKGKEVAKRPPVATSDGDSDSDVPISAMRPPQKKRRVERDNGDIADDQRSVIDEPISMVGVSPAHKLVTNAKGRGKGKQREQSTDSVSATPKQRKKPGPRKKLDNLPPATQELLGVGSAAPSVSGDATPVGSRPPSPTPTNISAMYELDEAIPPLKRARKVDDAAMMKRVKNLEEAQRKVWMNIARRDVAKVHLSTLVDLSPTEHYTIVGLQVSCHRLSDPSVPDEPSCDVILYTGTAAIREDSQGNKGRAG